MIYNRYQWYLTIMNDIPNHLINRCHHLQPAPASGRRRLAVQCRTKNDSCSWGRRCHRCHRRCHALRRNLIEIYIETPCKLWGFNGAIESDRLYLSMNGGFSMISQTIFDCQCTNGRRKKVTTGQATGWVSYQPAEDWVIYAEYL